MKYISHRCNTIEELEKTNHKYGVEVDIRSYKEQLIIHHDPYVLGEIFEDWIKAYDHEMLILNVKEEGLEERLIKIMNEYKIDDYFFLDQSFPFLIKWSSFGERRCAVRVSEFESVETAMTLAGKIDWVWVDCFSRLAMTYQDSIRLHQAGFNICLVSPELQGRDGIVEIPKLADLLRDQQIEVNAICTKMPELWEQLT